MAAIGSSNPISSVPESPITSVPESYPPSYVPHGQLTPQLVTHLTLDMRGEKFIVERETLLNLPESILLCLFPNGLILSKQQQLGWVGDEDDEDSQHFPVDYDPASFRYILSFWSQAHSRFYGTSDQPGLHSAQQHLNNPFALSSQPHDLPSNPGENPLIVRQPIIVLREELEYFSIVPSTSSSVNPLASTNPVHPSLQMAKVGQNGQPNEHMVRVKREAGKALLARGKVFTALQRNVSKEGNLAEQHLIDMLCMSGFNRDDDWGYRSLEPTKTVISSIALVLLKTGIAHPAPGENRAVTVDQAQMNTAQKLLLFWRKPARKCWWDGIEVEIPAGDGSTELTAVKVWARRVWTLELSLI